MTREAGMIKQDAINQDYHDVTKYLWTLVNWINFKKFDLRGSAYENSSEIRNKEDCNMFVQMPFSITLLNYIL